MTRLLLRRTAVWILAVACALWVAAAGLPFAGALPMAGLRLDYVYAVLALLAATAGSALVGHAGRPLWCAALAVAAAAVAALMVIGLEGLRPGVVPGIGFGAYLGGVGLLSAAALMSVASILEERRHGPLPVPARAEGEAVGPEPAGPQEPRASPGQRDGPRHAAPAGPTQHAPSATPVRQPGKAPAPAPPRPVAGKPVKPAPVGPPAKTGTNRL